MNIFQIRDVFQFAVRIEEDGERFYRAAVQVTDDVEVKGLFNYLADEELKHKKIFGDMLSSLGPYTPAETHPGEYLEYLRDYIDDKVVFTRDVEAGLSQARDVVTAINLALQREVDSIIFYQETKRFVSENRHGQIDNIIGEEREHFARLGRLKREYTARVS
jgi:rubrerythrin